MVRTRHRLRRCYGHPDGERVRNLYAHNHEFGQRLHEHCIGSCGCEHYASGRECDRRDVDLHDDLNLSLRCDHIRHELQLERARDRLRRGYGYTERERVRRIHCDRDQLGQRLHEHRVRSCGREYHATRCECYRRYVDLHDVVSYTFRRDHIRHELQLERARDRLWRGYGYTERERLRRLHGDRDQLGQRLHEHRVRSCGGEYHATRRQCYRRYVDLHDDVSYTFRCDHVRHELQLVWARYRFRRDDGYTERERYGRLHGDRDQLCQIGRAHV